MKKYNFYILSADEEEVFGFAYNLKRTIKFIYHINSKEVELFESIADGVFYKELEEVLQDIFNTYDYTKEYSYSQERMVKGIELLASNDLFIEQYGINKKGRK